MSTLDNLQYEKQCEEMTQLAETFLPLKRWGFNYSERLVRQNPVIIFDSQWCRVMFSWSGWDVYGGNSVGIYYGRHHATINEAVKDWNGEKCYCWHRPNEVLLFLDGLSPEEAVAYSTHGQKPNVMEAFEKSEVGVSLSGIRKQPEWLMRMHKTIWDQYGQRFFELFDMRRSDLWDEYALFIKNFYRVKGLSPDIYPPQDQIC
jgi:hypothetical protein